MAQREGFVELIGGHPTMLLDNAAAGERQNAAIAGQRHPREREQKRGHAG